MPIVGAVVLLIQFCFAYHALKTGRPYWWVFIIMGFPVMGCVIYYFVEVFPGSREQRRAGAYASDGALLYGLARAAVEAHDWTKAAGALAAYRALVPQFVGLEAAMQMFNDVVKHARRYSSAIEEEERWAEAAREAIAGH
jgi:hypothetical protein